MSLRDNALLPQSLSKHLQYRRLQPNKTRMFVKTNLCSLCLPLQGKTLTVTNYEHAEDIVKRCMDDFHITVSFIS